MEEPPTKDKVLLVVVAIPERLKVFPVHNKPAPAVICIEGVFKKLFQAVVEAEVGIAVELKAFVPRAVVVAVPP